MYFCRILDFIILKQRKAARYLDQKTKAIAGAVAVIIKKQIATTITQEQVIYRGANWQELKRWLFAW